ncbi:hypothetical protein DFQ28_009161 [Apophysomyces sp. BC1034]|nr:hypothetical protein DFQ30_002039 [Apophysomyces sp. BC1015]KAG0179257.1 hypothetical protein DFQ29_002318 [Apophysomyces sp. BC1021]KAG0192436.1 hypothetical protein DFQ28_009161 [Apophysomyces sp. BC1034]
MIIPSSPSFDPQSLLHTCIDNQSIQLVSILGIGAYGIVYLGRQLVTRRSYAIKLLTNPKAIHREIDIHAHLSGHPNILQFEKVVRQNNMTFIVLEYASEGDLFSAITYPTRGLVGNNEAIRYIFLQILDAVEHCHRQGISHRDLKPENVLVFPNWHIKLADFGLATTQLVSNEFGCGSTFYFSPECQGGIVRNNERIKGYSTQANDIWSLGVILINFAAGRNPWRQATMQDPTFAAYVHNPRHFFKTILPTISDELDYILTRIFCLDPALRISLPELRLRILRCNSFTIDGHISTKKDTQAAINLPIPQISVELECTESITETIMDYLCGFTDSQETEQRATPASSAAMPFSSPSKRQPPPPPLRSPSSRPVTTATTPATPPTPSCSSSSCSSVSSSTFSSDCPATPRIIISPIRERKQQIQSTVPLGTSLPGFDSLKL